MFPGPAAKINACVLLADRENDHGNGRAGTKHREINLAEHTTIVALTSTCALNYKLVEGDNLGTALNIQGNRNIEQPLRSVRVEVAIKTEQQWWMSGEWRVDMSADQDGKRGTTYEMVGIRSRNAARSTGVLAPARGWHNRDFWAAVARSLDMSIADYSSELWLSGQSVPSVHKTGLALSDKGSNNCDTGPRVGEVVVIGVLVEALMAATREEWIGTQNIYLVLDLRHFQKALARFDGPTTVHDLH
ncbi:hypothetical protein PAXRUDRAFT_26685 [Paxillus rubicundulus Ve08.2h10]|uniref:Uncharacterized protein n=1 Tax=Paxillus rubicundulus Ve08.2h10 TaxID=930991 RepID=A0A0D0DZH4_9AGAM|nr:hypothetical protein PAXRUDRAFT_26685 [Paxillus rubicundulus Ve08.2h10]